MKKVCTLLLLALLSNTSFADLCLNIPAEYFQSKRLKAFSISEPNLNSNGYTSFAISTSYDDFILENIFTCFKNENDIFECSQDDDGGHFSLEYIAENHYRFKAQSIRIGDPDYDIYEFETLRPVIKDLSIDAIYSNCVVELPSEEEIED